MNNPQSLTDEREVFIRERARQLWLDESMNWTLEMARAEAEIEWKDEEGVRRERADAT